jgi:hypothetical protein
MCSIARLDRFRDEWPEAEFGPAHIVLSDANLEDGHIDWCIALCDSVLDGTPWPDDWTAGNIWEDHEREEIEATRSFLRELRAVPEDERVEDGDTFCSEPS